jgi:hypothetical protein
MLRFKATENSICNLFDLQATRSPVNLYARYGDSVSSISSLEAAVFKHFYDNWLAFWFICCFYTFIKIDCQLLTNKRWIYIVTSAISCSILLRYSKYYGVKTRSHKMTDSTNVVTVYLGGTDFVLYVKIDLTKSDLHFSSSQEWNDIDHWPSL